MSKPSASKRAKELGCNSLRQVAEIVEVPERSIYEYFKNKPRLFDACCVYARETLKQSSPPPKSDPTTK